MPHASWASAKRVSKPLQLLPPHNYRRRPSCLPKPLRYASSITGRRPHVTSKKGTPPRSAVLEPLNLLVRVRVEVDKTGLGISELGWLCGNSAQLLAGLCPHNQG